VLDSERDWLNAQIDEVAAASFVSVDIRSVLIRPILYSRWASRRLVSASMRDTAQYIEQRFAQFQEEEYDVKLVAFDEFVDNCLRLDRVLRQPIGHALLIGSAGVGKTVISRFVSWMNGFSIFQIKAHSKYSEKDFQEDLRSVMKRCGCNGERVSFIVDESNILSPSFLEMMNALLASGCIPGLFVGDDLSKLLQACRESVIVIGTSSAGDGELLAAFHDSVRRHLHVIFTMNPATAEFNGRSASSPALFNRCVINWIGNWSHKSFQQVCCELLKDTDMNLCKTDSIDNNEFKAIVAQTLVSNHQCALDASRLSCGTFAHFSPRQFSDVISQFMALFQEKRNELDARQLHLISGLTRLLETECALATLQGQLREKNDELIRHNTQAETTLADMLGRQQEAEGRRLAVEQLALEVKEKQAATELRKSSVESRLKEVEPAVLEAQSAVRSIKKAQLDELRVMASPPAAVKTSLEAICTLLYGAKSPTWDDIRKFIRRDDFISGILDFDAKDMLKDAKRLKSVRAYFDDSSFNFENVNRSSKACGPLVKWMESQVMFAEVLEQVEPLRGELSKLNMDIDTLSCHKEAALSELQQLQSTIASCKESYALLISSVQTTKVEIASVTDKLSRSTQLIQSLESERRRWQIQQESFAGEQHSLLGDSVVCACFCVYSGCFDQEQRAGLLLSWIANAERCGIAVSLSVQPFKYISTAAMRLQWTQKGLPSDDLCAENACIMERSLRPSLAIDPSDIAGTFVNSCLKSKDTSTAVMTTFNDASFVRQLENCLRFGTPLIISDVVTVDAILFPLLNREFRKTGGRCLVRLGHSEIDCSPSFSLLMVSRCSKPIIGPDISSRITLVNFTITQCILQSQIMSMVLKHQRPEVEQQLHQLDFFKSECRGRLVELEDKLLGTLSDCQGSLLDNDSVITALQTLKSQCLSIVNQLAGAEGAHAAAAATCAVITPLAHFTSVLFFELQRLRQLKPYYVMSLLCFTSTVRGVLLQQPKDLSNDAVKQYTLEVFKAITSDVLMWVLQDDRVVACFIIARAFSAFCDQPLPEDEQVFFFSSNSSLSEEDPSLSPVFGSSVAAAVGTLSKLSRFLRLKQHILDHVEEWRIFASSSTAPSESPSTSTATSVPTAWMPACLPTHTQLWLGTLVARCFSPRLTLNMTRQWLHAMFAIHMLERETPDVSRLLPEDSRVPLLLLSSAGFDMGARVAAAASSASCVPSLKASPSLPLRSFTMGSSDASGGSTQSLDKYIAAAAANGGWVLVTNVHLAATAVLALQKKVAGLKLHPSFRLILTAEISHADAINQSTFDCSKIAVFEAPRSLRDVFLGSLFCIQPFCAPKPIERARVLLHVAWLHSVVITRLQYFPDGWTRRYEFNETDLCSAARIAGSWIDRAFVGGCIRDHLPMDSLDWTAIATLIAETVMPQMKSRRLCCTLRVDALRLNRSTAAE
jgi:dynein heavy chain 1